MTREPFIPFAVWYTGGRTRATMVRPPETDSPTTWKQDLTNIRDCGFNTVRCWVDWASGEPRRGEYHFETLDLLLSLSEEVGLKVIIQIYLDSAPDWLVKEYPDCRYISAGEVAIDSQGSPGYCYDHPGVRKSAEDFLTALARRAHPHPNFYAWDLWSEPHIVQWAYFDFLPQPPVFCYCHNTQQRFRDWLKRKYTDLEVLNRAWYRRFTTWDEIPAPKFISLMTYTDYIDWVHFIQNKLAEDLTWRQQAVKRGDDHLCTSHSAVPMVISSPLDEQGSPDDWLMARSVEVWGTSLYPKHAGARETQHAFFRSAMLTSTRSACAANNAPYWLGELQAGHGYVGMLASHMTPEDARQYLVQPLAHGAKGLCFYAWHPMSSGYESAGFGMANLDGSPSPRALVAGRLARQISKDMELFYQAKTMPAQTTVCLNNYANIMWQCMRQPWGYVPSRSYIGAYKALYRQHLPTDYIHPDEITQGKLDKYKVLYLPFAFMLPQTAADGIARFIEKGGVVLAEARTAWNDEHGYCGTAVPGLGLEKAFGCREMGAEGVKEDVTVPIRITQNHPAIPLLKAGDVLVGSRFKESMERFSPTAEVLGEFDDGSPAIVANRYGEGWAVFVGSLLSLAYYRFDDVNSGKLLMGMADLAGVQPPVTIRGVDPALELETHLLGSVDAQGRPAYILFAFNHSRQSLEAGFAFEATIGNYQSIEVLREKPVKHTWQGGKISLSTELSAGEIWVCKFTMK